MTKLAIVTGISAASFEDNVSVPVVVLVADEGYCITCVLGEASKAQVIEHFVKECGADGSELPPVFLWPMLLGQCVSKDAEALKDATVEVIYDFEQAA
jgi:hypothetical protein